MHNFLPYTSEMIIDRDIAPQVLESAAAFRAITITGPRQSGKTTLCRSLFREHRYLSLEDPDVRQRAMADPKGLLAACADGAILDEIQRAPDLLSYLQGIIDENPVPGRWIITSSENLTLRSSVSQSLAGRTDVFHLLPLTRQEACRFPSAPGTLDETLLTGSYPEVLQKPEMDASRWFRAYTQTYLERDAPQYIKPRNLIAFREFMGQAAGRVGTLTNYDSLAEASSITHATSKQWLSLLEAGFIVFRLPPYRRNIRKRLAKRPKLYFYDSGLACSLLGIRTVEQLRSHPQRGAIFENWVVSEIHKQRRNQGLDGGMYFYREQNRTETDIVIDAAHGVLLLECKSAATPDSHLFSPARRVASHMQQHGIPAKIAVAYGGSEYQQWPDGALIPWNSLEQYASRLPQPA